MKEEDKLIEKFGRKGPWSVPDGYFDAAREEVMSKLPEYPARPKPVAMSKWQRLKPYVYLAAMFAGIWCMMQVFNHVSGDATLKITETTEKFASNGSPNKEKELMIVPTTLSDVEFIEEFDDQYESIEDFEQDFGVELKPEYDNIDLGNIDL